MTLRQHGVAAWATAGLVASRQAAAASAARSRRRISKVLRKGVSRLLGRPNREAVAVASASMRNALERRAKRLDVSIRPQALFAPLPLLAGLAAALVAAAVLFSNGSSDDPLIWIGGLAIAFAAAAAVSATVGTLAVPELTVLGLATASCFAAFVGWQGLSLLWSIEPDRTWN